METTMQGLGSGFGFRAQGLRIRVQGLGFRVRVHSLNVQDLVVSQNKGTPI